MPCSYEKTLLPTLLAVANTSAHGENRITACSSSTPRWNSAQIAHLQALQASSHFQLLLRWTVLSRRAVGLPRLSTLETMMEILMGGR